MLCLLKSLVRKVFAAPLYLAAWVLQAICP